MAHANIFIRTIENGFIVGSGHADLIGRGGSGERYFPTFDDLVAAVPSIISTALKDAEDSERQMADERQRRFGEAGVLASRQAANQANLA